MEQNCRNLTDIPKQIIRDDGRYIATTYSVFSGIVFSFVEAHSQRIVDEDRKPSSNVLEIIYCREGRSEFNLNDEFVFLSSGDLMIVKANTVSHIMNFPIFFGNLFCSRTHPKRLLQNKNTGIDAVSKPTEHRR